MKQEIDFLDLTEKEKMDIELALEIMAKVSRAELDFARGVIDQYKIKTAYAEISKPYVMQYYSLENHKEFLADGFKDSAFKKNIDLLKH
jgi:hypothetical protein